MAETLQNVRYFILLLLHNMKNSSSAYKHICYIILLLHNCKCYSAIYTNSPQSLTSSAFTRSGVVGSDTKEVRLEKICNGKSKVELYIHEDSATVLTFNSSTPFWCHLELELFYVKGQYGFFIVFEEMNLSGTWPHTCGPDIVRFGRDNLIFDSYKSPKYCGKVDKLQLEGDENEFKKRVYTENIDREMDIWINLPSRTSETKLTLVVTPYKKVCGGSHPAYIPCFKEINCKDDSNCYKAKAESICVKKDLFCDGRVNCPYKHGGAADENSELCSGLKGTAAPQLALLIILLILLGAAAVFIYIMMRQFTVCGRKPRSSVTSYNTTGGGGGGGGGDLEMIPTSSASPSCPLNPPPYSEVVQNPPDDPPKYSDIFTQSTNIIKQ